MKINFKKALTKKNIYKIKYILFIKTIDILKTYGLAFILFPIKVGVCLTNILIGYIFGNLKYISKGGYGKTTKTLKRAICIGFLEEKREYFQEYIPNHDALYIHNYIPNFIILKVLKKLDAYDVFIWSYSEKNKITSFLKENNIIIHRVEQGFIISNGTKENKRIPLSLIIDRQDLYFNPDKESGLESIIFSRHHNYKDSDIKKSREYINEINTKKITRYNNNNFQQSDSLLVSLDEEKQTVLIIGQNEEEAAKLGGGALISNLDLVKLAYKENPNCNIIYKPYTDQFNKKIFFFNAKLNKKECNKFSEYSHIVTDYIVVFDLISTSDCVYTFSSHSGFEALLQGKKVVCLGSPFYAHWGLTDDRSKSIARREGFQLTIEQLFHASYIDYPTYLFGDLSQTINAIDEFYRAEEPTFKNEYKLYTHSFADINLVENSEQFTNQKIAIITTSEEISKLYTGIKSLCKQTQIFTLTLAVTRNISESGLVNSKEVSWLARHYLSRLSNMEDTVVLNAKKVSESYEKLLNITIGDTFTESTKEKLVSALTLGMEDNLFHQFSILESLDKLSDEHDKIIIFIDPTEQSKFFARLLLSKIDNNKILFAAHRTKNIKRYRVFLDNDIDERNRFFLQDPTYIFHSNYFRLFKKLWNELSSSAANNDHYGNNSKRAIVCGALLGRTYAYHPTSVEIITLLNKAGFDITFIPSHALNDTTSNQYKWLLFEISSNAELIHDYVRGNKRSFINKLQRLLKDMESVILYSIDKKYSSQTSDYLRGDIKRALNTLPNQILFFSEAMQASKNSNILVTSMDRTVYSRLATIAAQVSGGVTVGVQPLLISTSARQQNPIVDYMCVIDEMQKDNYHALGFDKNKMVNSGSPNLRKHIKQIEDEKPIHEISNGHKVSLLFIMQHSFPDLMIKSIKKLIDIYKNTDILLFIKPHPHQELNIVLKTASLIESYQNITLLEASENTYLYIKSCTIIIGYTSNAVLEAMLANKDVVILKDYEVDKSIDFAQLNISLSSDVNNEIEEMVMHYANDSKLANKVRSRREQYINNSEFYYSDSILFESLKKWSNE